MRLTRAFIAMSGRDYSALENRHATRFQSEYTREDPQTR
jgi:hypothetical protein